jgi:hypothetical protein
MTDSTAKGSAISNARIIMGADQAALVRASARKRGEAEPEVISAKLILQPSLVE